MHWLVSFRNHLWKMLMGKQRRSGPANQTMPSGASSMYTKSSKRPYESKTDATTVHKHWSLKPHMHNN